MEDPFKPLSLSIKELFGNTDSLYKIPQYQRPYKWEDEQVDKLWDDIYEAYENGEDNYFLGSVITAKPRDDAYSYPKVPLIITAKKPPITISKRPRITVAKKPLPILNQTVAVLYG